MKKLFLVVACVMAFQTLSAKSKTSEEQSFDVRKVIEVPGVGKDELFVLCFLRAFHI